MRMQVLQVLDRVGIDYIENPEKLKSLLCPLIAKTAEQQDVFYEQFDRYIEQIKVPLPELPPQPKWYEQIPRWVFALFGIALLSTFAFLIYNNLPSPQPQVSFIIKNKTPYKIGDILEIENTSDCVEPQYKWEVWDNISSSDTINETNDGDWKLNLTTSKGDKKIIRLTLLNPPQRFADSTYFFQKEITVRCADFPQVEKANNWKKEIKVDSSFTFSLKNKEPGLRYQWSYNGDEVSTDTSFTKTFDSKGIHRLQVSITRPDIDGLCTHVIDHTITVNDETPIAYLEPKKLIKEKPMMIGKYNHWYWGLLGLLSLFPLFFWYRWWNSKTTSETEAATKSFQSRFDAPDRAPYFIPFRPFDHVIHAGQSLYRLGNLLRARQEGVGTNLNIPKTVQATIEKGGFPEFRLDKNTQPTEYLFLIDQQHRDSIQAHLFDHLVTFLVSKDIYAERYFYNTGFFSFWKKNESEALGLEQLNRLYPYHRLVIMGDAHELLSDEVSNSVRLKKDYQYYLNRWQGRIVLTPVPSSSWAVEEAGLHQVFEVFPADMQGLMDAFGELNKGREEEEDSTTFKQWRSRQQLIRKEKDIRYQKWRSPEHIKNYLTDHPTLWKWLCALAVHPSINWNLTLAIGNALASQGVEINHDQLLILSRIPWLQKGHFSSTLRLKLLKELDLETERLARQAAKEELEAVENLTRNSFVNFELQADLAIQNFLLEPENKVYQDVIRQYLTKDDGSSALGKNRIKELDQQINKFQLAKRRKAVGIEMFLQKQNKERTKKQSILINDAFIFAVVTSIGVLSFFVDAFLENNTEELSQVTARRFFFDQFEVASSKAAELNNAAVELANEFELKKLFEAEKLLDSALILQEDYPLAKMNKAKTIYNIANAEYNMYHGLIEMTIDYPLGNATQEFRKIINEDSVGIDAIHGIGLCYYYSFLEYRRFSFDSAWLYLNTINSIDSTYFTDTLKSKPPHLASLLDSDLLFTVIYTVVDAKSDMMLKDVKVTGNRINGFTDENGIFSFQVSVGELNQENQINFSKDGYKTRSTSFRKGYPVLDLIIFLTPMEAVLGTAPSMVDDIDKYQNTIDSLYNNAITKLNFLKNTNNQVLNDSITQALKDLSRYKDSVQLVSFTDVVDSHLINEQVITQWKQKIANTILALEKLKTSTPSPTSSILTDSRDGQRYKTITIGTQTWMAENLNYTTPDSWCYFELLPDLCNKLGRFYTWKSAKIACPTGWHLPSNEEWKTLVDNYGGTGIASYKALIDGGTSGFLALLGGILFSDGEFEYLDKTGYYWSVTEYDIGNAWSYFFDKESGKVYRDDFSKTFALNCRCIKD